MAAYDARLYTHLLNSGGSYLSSWDYLSESLFEGNPSISYHVARNIFEMAGMNRIQTIVNADRFLRKTEVGALAGVDSQSGKMCIMVYNFGNSLNYASKAEVSLTIKAESEKEDYNLTIFKVDNDCNWFDEWVEDRRNLGIKDSMFTWSPDDACGIAYTLSDAWAREQYKSLRPKYKICSELIPETSTIKPESLGILTMKLALQPNTVWFIHIE